jgi:hypothetical protein
MLIFLIKIYPTHLVLKKKRISLMQKIIYSFLRTVGESILEHDLIKKIIRDITYISACLITTTSTVICLVFTIFFIPRFNLAFSLIMDVFLLNTISNFYNAISLMLIPIAFQALLGLIKIYCTSGKNTLENTYIISKNQFTAKNSVTIDKINKDKMLWELYSNMLDVIAAIYAFQKVPIYLFSAILCTVLFLLGWATYLVKIQYYSWIANGGQSFFYLCVYYLYKILLGF